MNKHIFWAIFCGILALYLIPPTMAMYFNNFKLLTWLLMPFALTVLLGVALSDEDWKLHN